MIIAPTLVQVVTELAKVYKDEGAAIWLNSPQFDRSAYGNSAAGWGPPPITAKTALDLVAAGRGAEVLAAVERLQVGAE